MADDPEAVLDYWLGDVGPQGWYGGGDELDAEIRDRFGPLWEAAASGGLDHWVAGPGPTLAFIVLTDQFPRNMWRGTARAFATDAIARAAAEKAIAQGWDLAAPEPDRQFFYLPLMHHEDEADQQRSIALIAERMPETGAENVVHAKVHHEIIRLFGRFPYRNEALGRETTPDEADFLQNGGYAKLLAEVKAGS